MEGPIENVRLGVGAQERDLSAPLAPERRGEHLGRNVEADDAPGRTDGVAELEGRLPAPAADGEHVLAGARSEGIERGTAERIELAIEPLLLRDPGVASTAVPVFDLLLIHRRGVVHGAESNG